MMRRPSTISQLHEWWNAAIAQRLPPIHEGQPECGYFKRRIVKGGPWIPVRIWCEREIDPETGELTAPEVLRCMVNGQPRDPADQWTYLTPIPRDEYDALARNFYDVPEVALAAETKTPIDLTRRPLWIP